MKAQTLLVVDGDVELREALIGALRAAGYRVLGAGDGERAMSLLERHSVQMVISDVYMPGMSGHTLLRQVRQRFPHTSCLLMSAYGTVHNAVQAMRHGALDYLVKPFPAQVLIDRVARHIADRAR